MSDTDSVNHSRMIKEVPCSSLQSIRATVDETPQTPRKRLLAMLPPAVIAFNKRKQMYIIHQSKTYVSLKQRRRFVISPIIIPKAHEIQETILSFIKTEESKHLFAQERPVISDKIFEVPVDSMYYKREYLICRNVKKIVFEERLLTSTPPPPITTNFDEPPSPKYTPTTIPRIAPYNCDIMLDVNPGLENSAIISPSCLLTSPLITKEEKLEYRQTRFDRLAQCYKRKRVRECDTIFSSSCPQNKKRKFDLVDSANQRVMKVNPEQHTTKRKRKTITRNAKHGTASPLEGTTNSPGY